MSPDEPLPAPHQRNAGLRADLTIACALAALSVALYASCVGFGFVVLDDGLYVTENAVVQRGLSWESVAAVFGFADGYSWLPVTMLSHMLDVTLFGLEPAGHHLSSVVIHALAAALLFLLLSRCTRARGKSLLVALAFALHPLQVESVAWVAERKNVLSTLLMLLCIWSYAAYARRPSAPRYLGVCALFLAGLMAKPMLVTLPVLLLLLDLWPLGRFARLEAGAAEVRRTTARLVVEKLPLLALALASAVATVLSQRTGGAMRSGESVELPARLANAAIAALRYLYALVWPADLAIQYPHPYLPHTGGVPPMPQEIAAAVALLLGITALVLWSRSAVLVAGWSWYLVALAPVLGLIQVGAQGWADRYAYVPLLGVFVMVVWGGGELLDRARQSARGRLLRAGVLAVASAWLCMLAVRTHAQQQHWRDSLALYTHAVRVSPGNSYLHFLLAQEWKRRGELRRAAEHYAAAVQIAPDAKARGELGSMLLALGHADQAIEQFRLAMAEREHPPGLRVNLANALVSRGDVDEGIALLREAAAHDPGSHLTLYNLANALAQAGRLAEAIEHYRRVLALQPDFVAATFNWGNTLALQGNLDAAIEKFREAAARQPGHPRAKQALDRALALKQQAAAR